MKEPWKILLRFCTIEKLPPELSEYEGDVWLALYRALSADYDRWEETGQSALDYRLDRFYAALKRMVTAGADKSADDTGEERR